MKIRNAIIITDADSEVHLRLGQMEDFTGNIVFDKESLPADLVKELYRRVGKLVQGAS